ncbi:MAG: hypothetical protein M3332_08075 [Actinomycetota bacterium]|jgi:hypothetical protein|nr:hypothetical protein [Actinomycetota bacterium]
MGQEPEAGDQSDDVASPVPNRRERRGAKSGHHASTGSKSTVGRRPGPVKQFTRRRSGG